MIKGQKISEKVKKKWRKSNQRYTMGAVGKSNSSFSRYQQQNDWKSND